MKSKFLVLALFFAQLATAQSYQKVHKKALLIDSHNDILSKVMEREFVIDQDLTGKTHSDLNRLKKGGLDMQFFSVWSDGNQKNPYKYAMRQMDTLDAVIKRNPDKIVKVKNSKELLKAVKQHKIAAMIGVEGGHQIEDDLKKLDTFFQRGTRYMTLTWNNSTHWASSAADETKPGYQQPKGLNELGKKIVQHMNQLGMMIDISHVGEQTFWDVINLSTKPVIASHSSVYTICKHRRNLKDEQIKAIAKNGGVVQINFYPLFLDSTAEIKFDALLNNHKEEFASLMKTGLSEYVAGDILVKKYSNEIEPLRPPLSLLIKHIEYIINLVGVDYVGIGSDFDGIEFTPQQMDDVTSYPLITKALLQKGYSKKNIYKIMGGNMLRVLKANEQK